MSEAHTKGPWRLSSVGFVHNDGSVPVLNSAEDDGESKVICTVNIQTKAKRGEAWKTPCAERDANALLIASAPDLLEALEVFAGPPENGEAETAVPDGSEVTIRCQLGDLRRARAALSKATGGANG